MNRKKIVLAKKAAHKVLKLARELAEGVSPDSKKIVDSNITSAYRDLLEAANKLEKAAEYAKYEPM